jgi:hypothetical protein
MRGARCPRPQCELGFPLKRPATPASPSIHPIAPVRQDINCATLRSVERVCERTISLVRSPSVARPGNRSLTPLEGTACSPVRARASAIAQDHESGQSNSEVPMLQGVPMVALGTTGHPPAAHQRGNCFLERVRMEAGHITGPSGGCAFTTPTSREACTWASASRAPTPGCCASTRHPRASYYGVPRPEPFLEAYLYAKSAGGERIADHAWGMSFPLTATVPERPTLVMRPPYPQRCGGRIGLRVRRPHRPGASECSNGSSTCRGPPDRRVN